MAAESTQALLATELVPSGQLVTFTLDGVEFGLDIDRVQERHDRTSHARSNRLPASASSSGVAVRYQYVLLGLTWPR